MYNTNAVLNREVKKAVTQEDILSKFSEYDIFAKYIGEFKIGNIYNSPIRKDGNPSFGIFVSYKTGSLLYKDLANGDCGNVFKFVKQFKNMSTYKETLESIANDLNLSSIDVAMDSAQIKTKSQPRETLISVTRKPLNLKDIDFWSSFGISKETLKTFQVSPISRYFLNGTVKWNYVEESPMYCYKIFNKFKIYRPFEKGLNKWRGNLGPLDIQGFEQLPESDDLLIITKSLKDVMVLHEMGYHAVSPASESSSIPEIVMRNLTRRFRKIIVFYDRDKAGMTFARKLSKEYKLNCIFINKKHKTKDISDLVKHKGYATALTLFEQMIN